MNSRSIFLFFSYFLLLLFIQGEVQAQTKSNIKEMDLARQREPENLNVFQQWIRWNNGGSLLMNHLIKQAFDLYEIRDKEISKLKTGKDWIDRQQEVKRRLMEIIGPFPEKSPLRPVVTGTIDGDGYRIEKIVYESMPGFYVTGCLYIPENIKGKAPAVLNLIGHEQESFRAVLDQVVALNLVKKGMVVFTIDPLGQGEHLQYFDTKVNFSSIGYSVIEHCYFGNQCFISGFSSAKYFVWDGIRAIDYLVSRKEVDAARIGVTGFSGGGTITSYLGALDDRVKVAIPSSWSNAARRQLETKGAQDAEATLVHSVAKGITFEDLIEVRAPKPTLMTFTSRDEYLCLQGAREAYLEAKNAYRALSAEDNLALVEDDSKHWLTPKIREAIYGFFMKHFGMSGDVSEVDVNVYPAEQLMVTKTGQISTSLGGKMVFDVNKAETSKLIERLQASRKEITSHLSTVVKTAKEISGYAAPTAVEEPFMNGRYQRDGYTVAKYALRGEGEYAIPFLLFVPDDGSATHPGMVYLHPKGKIAEAQPGGEIEKLVRKGFIVAATDILGVGETENTASRGLADGYMAVLIGRSVVGIQAGDIVRIVNYLKSRPDVDEKKIGAIGMGRLCLPLIHAAAFDPSINNISLIGSPVSYRSIVMNRFYRIGITVNEGGGIHHPYEVDFSWGIAKVLTGYDLPDLIASIAPRKVLLAGLTDQNMEPASQELISEDMAFPLEAFRHKNAAANIKILPAVDAGAELDWTFE
ncbi:MAG: alpha/beta hydrolase family protein [Cyclobacteriaceae bacterium]